SCFASPAISSPSTDKRDHSRSKAGVRPGCSAKQVIGQSGNLQQPIDCDQQEDEYCREIGHPLLNGHAAHINGEEGQQELRKYVDEGAGNDLVERVLKKGFEPAPEKPIHLRHDKERNEY